MRNNLISIILPCQNEEESLPLCLESIQQIVRVNQLNAEIIVSDSSTDNSPKIVKEFKVILVKHDKDGYGRAYLEGFKAAKGEVFFMADCDGSYDFAEIPRFIKEIENGVDFVIGNRFTKNLKKESMPWANRYIGNPMLTALFNIFFKSKISDVHCGMRAIRRDALEKLNLKTTGMEFASEMVIKAIKSKLNIVQLSIDYHPRQGKSKLKPVADAWRHLRFMLLYSPMFLFFIPGIAAFVVGVLSMLWFMFGSGKIFGMQFYYHPMFISSLLIIIGYQTILFALFAKSYAVTHLGEQSLLMDNLYRNFSIEKALSLGVSFALIGFLIFFTIFYKWYQAGFSELNEVRSFILALTLLTLGIQTFFSAFMLSILGIKE